MAERQAFAIAYTADGGRTTQVWFVTEDQWQQVHDMLGAPDLEQIASPEIVEQANHLTAQTIVLEATDGDA